MKLEEALNIYLALHSLSNRPWQLEESMNKLADYISSQIKAQCPTEKDNQKTTKLDVHF